jgi:hypothetical protein
MFLAFYFSEHLNVLIFYIWQDYYSKDANTKVTRYDKYSSVRNTR